MYIRKFSSYNDFVKQPPLRNPAFAFNKLISKVVNNDKVKRNRRQGRKDLCVGLCFKTGTSVNVVYGLPLRGPNQQF